MQAQTPGLGVATATTVLASVWPERHAIFDRFTHWAVAAVRCAVGDPPRGLDPEAKTGAGSPNWDRYIGWRQEMIASASELEIELWELERAVWLSYRALNPTGMTWGATGRALTEMLDRGP